MFCLCMLMFCEWNSRILLFIVDRFEIATKQLYGSIGINSQHENYKGFLSIWFLSLIFNYILELMSLYAFLFASNPTSISCFKCDINYYLLFSKVVFLFIFFYTNPSIINCCAHEIVQKLGYVVSCKIRFSKS